MSPSSYLSQLPLYQNLSTLVYMHSISCFHSLLPTSIGLASPSRKLPWSRSSATCAMPNPVALLHSHRLSNVLCCSPWFPRAPTTPIFPPTSWQLLLSFDSVFTSKSNGGVSQRLSLIHCLLRVHSPTPDLRLPSLTSPFRSNPVCIFSMSNRHFNPTWPKFNSLFSHLAQSSPEFFISAKITTILPVV